VARPFVPLGELKLCPDENRTSHTDSEARFFLALSDVGAKAPAPKAAATSDHKSSGNLRTLKRQYRESRFAAMLRRCCPVPRNFPT
jgi:hypothetical protein